MHIHSLQHVPFEGLGSIEVELLRKGHHLSNTQLYKNEPLPAIDNVDWLIIMGGPMEIYDETEFPWLQQERDFIRQVIKAGKTVLGICLGARLIAAALGAKVYKTGIARSAGSISIAIPQ